MNEFFVKLLGAFFLVSLITACGLVKSGEGSDDEDSLIDREQVDQLSLTDDVDTDTIGGDFLPTEEEVVDIGDLIEEIVEQAGDEAADIAVLELVLDLINVELHAFEWSAPASEGILKASLSVVVSEDRVFGVLFRTWDEGNTDDPANNYYTFVCESLDGCSDVEVLKEGTVFKMTFSDFELMDFVDNRPLILSSGSLVIDTSED